MVAVSQEGEDLPLQSKGNLMSGTGLRFDKGPMTVSGVPQERQKTPSVTLSFNWSQPVPVL